MNPAEAFVEGKAASNHQAPDVMRLTKNLHCTLTAVWQFSNQKNAHEPDRRKSPGAHTLQTSSYAPRLPSQGPGMPPGAVQDEFEADFIVKLEVRF